MTLRKASTLVYFAGFLVAAAMLSDARPTAAMPALSVTSSAAQPMAAAGSDATANQGVALASLLRNVDPMNGAATLAKAASKCTRSAALCEKLSRNIGTPIQIRDCLMCKNSCNVAVDLAIEQKRPKHEWHHWENARARCSMILLFITNH